MSITSDVKRKYDLLYHLSKGGKPTMIDLGELTGIPVPTIKRQLKSLSKDFGVKVLFVRDVSARGMSGYYTLTSWGVFDKDSLLGFYGRHV